METWCYCTECDDWTRVSGDLQVDWHELGVRFCGRCGSAITEVFQGRFAELSAKVAAEIEARRVSC